MLGWAVGWVVGVAAVERPGSQQQQAADSIVKRHQDLRTHSRRAQPVVDIAEGRDYADRILAAVHSSAGTAVDTAAGAGDIEMRKGRIGFASSRLRLAEDFRSESLDYLIILKVVCW